MKKLLLAFLLVPATFGQTLRYIDWDTGNDANDGASTSTPWKRSPFMRGYTGTFNTNEANGSSHIHFIFKGGVTWTGTNVFPLRVGRGGVSDSQRMVFRSTNTWFTGASWSRPVFDFENRTYGDDWSGAGFYLKKPHVLIGDIEFKRHKARKPSGTTQARNYTIALQGLVSNFMLSNCIVRDWSLEHPVGSGQDGGGGAIIHADASGTNRVVTHCEMHQEFADNAHRTGKAIQGNFEVVSNRVHHTPNPIFGVRTIISNYVYEIVGATDPLAHENGPLINSMASPVAFNVVSNCVEYGYNLWPTFISNPSTLYNTNNNTSCILFHNNIEYNTKGVWLTTSDKAVTTNVAVRIYNNAFYTRNGFDAIHVASNLGNWDFGLIEIQNNLIITNQPHSSGDWYRPNNQVLISVLRNNVVLSAATAATQGYTIENLFRPTAANNATVNAGTAAWIFWFNNTWDSATRTGTWDVGPFEWSEVAGPPGTRILHVIRLLPTNFTSP